MVLQLSVNENVTAKEVADVWDKTIRLRNGPLVLCFFAQCRTILLKQIYTVLNGSTNPCEHQQGHGVP